MANGSRHSFYMIQESTYGQAVANPAMLKVRHTNCNIAIAKDSLQSQELRSDRQIVDFRLGQNKVGGQIGTELSVDSQFTMLLEALMCGTWTSNVLKAGTTRRSFMGLRVFEDMPVTEKAFHQFLGLEVASCDLKLGAGQIGTAVFETIGQSASYSTAAPTDAVLGSAGTASVMDAFTGAITEGGSSVAVVTEVSLKIDNNMDRKFVIGSKNTLQPSQGRSIVTGSMTAYFESTALLDKFINESSSSLVFTASAGAQSLQFNVPNLKYTGGQPDVSGEGPVLLTMPFQAVYSSANATQLAITRVP